MTDYVLSTRDYGRTEVGPLRVYVLPLAKSGRTREVIQRWVDDVREAYSAAPNDPVLRAIVWEIGSEAPGDMRDLYEYLSERIAGVRWFLVGNAAERVSARAGSRLTGPDRRDYRRRVWAGTAGELEDAVLAVTWPTIEDPARGGSGVRIGPGPHVPWDLVITEHEAPVAVQRDAEGAVLLDAHGISLEAVG